MKIELGKKYIRRDRKVTGALTLNPDLYTAYPFMDPVTSRTYTTDGATLRGYPHDEDLIAEYVEPQSREAELEEKLQAMKEMYDELYKHHEEIEAKLAELTTPRLVKQTWDPIYARQIDGPLPPQRTREDALCWGPSGPLALLRRDTYRHPDGREEVRVELEKVEVDT